MDLKDFISQEKNKNQIYELIGLIEHHESTELGGHYISNCQNFEDKL